MPTSETTTKVKRTIPPEQLEKMRLGRIAKAKERKEEREKNKAVQKQAIEQQQERIELLKTTKKKKAEIKRRLAAVKRGEDTLEEVEEIIEQYQPKTDNEIVMDITPNTGAEPPVSTPQGGREPQEEEQEEPKEEEKEEPKEDKEFKEKVREIKNKEIEKVKKLETETLKFDLEYQRIVNEIHKSLPDEAKTYFKTEADAYNPNLDIEQNIKNMIGNINNKINKNVLTVKKVKESIDEIHTEEVQKETTNKKANIEDELKLLEIKKKRTAEKLQMLYKLR